MPNMTLAERLKTLRTDRRLIQAVAADAIGIARSTLAGYEAGHDKPGRETLAAIASYYGVSLDYLQRGIDTAPGGPCGGDLVKDADELALLRFWRSLSRDERRMMLRMLNVDSQARTAA